MKYIKLMFVGLLLGCGVSALLKVITAAPTKCKEPYRQDTKITIGTNVINAEIAKTDQQKTTGLSDRSCIGVDQGMLFVFDKPDSYSFWMKDMKFPIDIIWVSETNTVNKVKANASPSTYPDNFTNTEPAKYVLEIQADRSRQLNIAQGTQLEFNL
jgi:uncharacterized membrane protein (UPF0127 family)